MKQSNTINTFQWICYAFSNPITINLLIFAETMRINTIGNCQANDIGQIWMTIQPSLLSHVFLHQLQWNCDIN